MGACRAAVDHQDENGCTALVLAAIAGSSALLPTLLAAGANTELKDSFGSTALDYAKAEEHDLAAELLLAAGMAEQARVQCETSKQRYEQAAEMVAASEAALRNNSDPTAADGAL